VIKALRCHRKHQAVIKGDECMNRGTICSIEWKTIPLARISMAMFMPTGPVLIAKKAKKTFLMRAGF